MPEDLLTVAEVAKLLRLNPQTIRNWIDAGDLRAVRAGRRVFIRRDDLEQVVGTDDISADTLLTVAEVASELRLNPQTVRNAIDDRRMRAVRIGRRVRVRRVDVDAYLQVFSRREQADVDVVVTAEEFWLGTPLGANLDRETVQPDPSS